MTRLELPALLAHSVLGFLAGVGTLRLVSEELQDDGARLGWPNGPYSGAVLESGYGSIESLTDALYGIAEATRSSGRLLPGVDRFPPTGEQASSDPTSQLSVAEARRILHEHDRALESWVPAIVGMVPPVDRKTRLADALDKNRFLRAGPGTVWVSRTLAHALNDLDSRLMREALSGWRRVDGFIGAYLDPRADVDKATAAGRRAPPKRGVPGATWLALMALPLFPVRASDRFLAETVGWRANRATPKGFQWPVWGRELSVASVTALIDHRVVANASPGSSDDVSLIALGVNAVFRSVRVSAGNNDAAMAPADVIWGPTG